MPQQKTLALDRTAWDLVLDINGDIATVTNPYSIAQDVASAIRCFRGECWYDSGIGVPYLSDIFNSRPPLSLIANRLETEALRIAHVQTAKASFTEENYRERTLSGAVIVTDDLNNTMSIGI